MRWPVVVFTGYVLHHAGAVLHVMLGRGISPGDQLARWDAIHYASLAADGYRDALWAFFPLFPSLVALVGRPLQALGAVRLEVVGAGLSLVLFAIFMAVAAWAARSARTEPERLLTPQSGPEWVFLVFSPASYVLHTAHTEALFLLLSFVALWSAARQQVLWAGLAAGLAALTRNQGVFVAVIASLWCLGSDGPWGPRLRRAAGVGVVSFACFAAWLGYQAAVTGDALSFLAAQRQWPHAASLMDLVRALTFTNARQPPTAINLIDFALFWVLLGLALRLLRASRHLAGYALLSLAVVPLQSETTNVARFGVVLFPLWLEAGRLTRRLPPWAQVAVLAGVVALNNWFTHRFLKGAWAY